MNPGDRERCRALDRLADTLVTANKHAKAKRAARTLRGASARLRRMSDENAMLRRLINAERERASAARKRIRRRTVRLIEKITAAMEQR